MTRPSRRELLCGTAGLLALTAGCIDDLSGDQSGEDDNGDTDDENGNGDAGDENGNGDTGDENGDGDDDTGDDENGDSGGVDGLADSETLSFQHAEVGEDPDAELFVERDAADDWLGDRDLDDDSVTEFVDDTDFETASLVALEASAPNLCYEMVLESYRVDDGVIELEATVSDESAADEACAQQETTVGRLVRATDDGEPVTELSATIVDRDGSEHGFGAGVDSASD